MTRMKKLQIGLDFDGVVVDSAKLKARAAEKLFGKKGKIHGTNFKREIVVGNGWLTDKEYDKVCKCAYNKWYYGQLMEAMPGARFYLSALNKEGHNLFIITSRDSTSFPIADKWLGENGFQFVSRTGIGLKQSKAPLLKALSADIFVDDDLDKLLPLQGIVEHLFLFSWPWHKNIKLPPGIVKLDNGWNRNPWKQFYLEICRIREPQLAKVIK